MNVFGSGLARLKRHNFPISQKHEKPPAGNSEIHGAGTSSLIPVPFLDLAPKSSFYDLPIKASFHDSKPLGSDIITVQYRSSPMLYMKFAWKAIGDGHLDIWSLRKLVAEQLKEQDPWRVNLVYNSKTNPAVNLEEYDASEVVSSLGMTSNWQNLIHVDISDCLILRDSSTSSPVREGIRIVSIRYYAFNKVDQVKEKIARLRDVHKSKIRLSHLGQNLNDGLRLGEVGVGPGSEIVYQIEIPRTRAMHPSSTSPWARPVPATGNQEHKEPQRQSPASTETCSHKSFTSCQLSTSLPCCACADKRPNSVSNSVLYTASYPMYTDGVGMTTNGTRQQGYCPSCKAYLQKNPSTFPTSQAQSSNSQAQSSNPFRRSVLTKPEPAQRTAPIESAIPNKYREPNIPENLRPTYSYRKRPSKKYFDYIRIIPSSGADYWMQFPPNTIRNGLTVSQLRTLMGRSLGVQDIWRVNLTFDNEAVRKGTSRLRNQPPNLERHDCQFGENAPEKSGESASLQSLGMESNDPQGKNVIYVIQTDYLLLQCQEKYNATFSVRFEQFEKVGEIRELLAKRENCLAGDIHLFYKDRELKIDDRTLMGENISSKALIQWRQATSSSCTKLADRSSTSPMSSNSSKITGPRPFFYTEDPRDPKSLLDNDVLFILHEGSKQIWMRFPAGTIQAERLTFNHLRTILAEHLALQDPWRIAFFNGVIDLESSEIDSEIFYPVEPQRGPIKTFLSRYILFTGPKRSIPISNTSLMDLRSIVCRMANLPGASRRIRLLYKGENFNDDPKELFTNYVQKSSGTPPEITFIVDAVPSLEVRFAALDGKKWSQYYSEDDEVSIGDIRNHAANRLGIDDVRKIQLSIDGVPLQHDLWRVNQEEFKIYFKASPNNTIIVEASDYFVLKCEDDIHLIHFDAGAIDRGLVSVLRIRYEAAKSLGKGFRVFNEEKIRLVYRERELKCSATPTLLAARDAGLLCGSELRCEFKETRDRDQYLRDIEKEVEARGVRKTAIECSICGDNKPAADFPKQITEKCAHEVHTCRECLQSWIASNLESRAWNKISCSECKETLHHSDVQTHASTEIFQKYDQLATRAALNTISEFRWCISPAGCISGQIHESGAEGPIFRCISCGFKACTVHERAWHEGETCEEYDYRINPKKKKAEEEASTKLVEKIAKNCPGCEWRIEKISGCDHMTCSRCSHEFCYLCSAGYAAIRETGNSAHESSCRYHSSNIR